MKIENSAKAIIIENKKVLMIKNYNELFGGDWYCLPGGRQEFGENLLETLKRECKEEINVTPIPQKLLFVREYIHDNHMYKGNGRNQHKIEFMYLCTCTNIDLIDNGYYTDDDQRNIEWISLDEIKNLNIYPKKLKDLKTLLALQDDIYWGDIL